MNFSWCKQADVGLPKPDLVLYLDLSSEAMAKRSGFGEERYESEDFQNEVKKVYGLLREDNWKVILYMYLFYCFLIYSSISVVFPVFITILCN